MKICDIAKRLKKTENEIIDFLENKGIKVIKKDYFLNQNIVDFLINEFENKNFFLRKKKNDVQSFNVSNNKEIKNEEKVEDIEVEKKIKISETSKIYKVKKDFQTSSFLSNARTVNKRKKKFKFRTAVEKKKKEEKRERILEIKEESTVFELSKVLKIDSTKIMEYFFLKGIKTTLNTVLPNELMQEIAENFNVLLDIQSNIEDSSVNEGEKRDPIIVIVGHVDHGKTTLIDNLLKSNNVIKEAGGITQTIKAYQIEKNNKKITLIDTPGHEDFMKMRSKGISITDVAILVVAVDDGVMPQTIEAIKQSKLIKVPIIVALNKIDKGTKKIDEIKGQLSNYGIVSKEWGGDNQFVEISALQNKNIDKLLNTIVESSQDLKAPHEGTTELFVLESCLDKKRGASVNAIVRKGTLKKGEIAILNDKKTKIKIMEDFNGKTIETAVPSTPIYLYGIGEIMNSGDIIYVVNNEKEAQKILNKLESKNKKIKLNLVNSEKILNVIIVSSYYGAIDAIKQNLIKLNNKEIGIQILNSKVGNISKIDIDSISKIGNGVIVFFNNKIDNKILDYAKKNKVKIFFNNIIYRITEKFKEYIESITNKEQEEQLIGVCEVIKTFYFSKIGNIAGCRVINGKVLNNTKAIIYRDNNIISKTQIISLKIDQNQVKEANEGQECGILLKNNQDINLQDKIEIYK